MLGRVIKESKKSQFYTNSEILKVNDVVNIRIHETVLESPDKDWFLIDMPNQTSPVYCSDAMIDRGDITRHYTDPTLGEYRKAKVGWVSSDFVEITPTTNISAKYLLTSGE